MRSTAYDSSNTTTSTGSALAPPNAFTPNCSRMPASKPAAMLSRNRVIEALKAPDMPSKRLKANVHSDHPGNAQYDGGEKSHAGVDQAVMMGAVAAKKMDASL